MYPEDIDNGEAKKFFIELDEDSYPVVAVDFEND